ncbi:MAG: hypothetical protein NT074_09000 [Methanomicrobiales archaeon]|nr:hypothetical protein [Methanomicrobiales archaeon]
MDTGKWFSYEVSPTFFSIAWLSGFSMRPAYLTLTGLDEIAQRADLATARLRDCTLCPRRCRVDRLVGEQG